MKVLFIGDIVGNPGRKAVKRTVAGLKDEYCIDFCVANGENASGGNGITNAVAKELYMAGIDAMTLGNHTWAKREILDFIDEDSRLIRPANFPPGIPGKGSAVIEGNNCSLGVINLIGRIYMENADCPFRTALKEIDYLKSFTDIILVDIHAEATSEKYALAWYLDGKVSCIAGTHTHVQTSDERILPQGTGYITDAGMTGPSDGIIGVEKGEVIKRFLTGIPQKYSPAKGNVQFNAVLFDIDPKSARTTDVKRISRVYTEL